MSKEILQPLEHEIDIIKSIYISDFSVLPREHGYVKSFNIEIYPDEDKGSSKYRITLSIHIPQKYPTQIPKIDIDQYMGITYSDVQIINDLVLDTSMKMIGQNMIHTIIETCKEHINTLYSKYQHSMRTRENLYEKFQMNQKLRAEQQKKNQEKASSQSLNNINEDEEENMRKQWFSLRKDNTDEKIENIDDINNQEDYSLGCELIPFKDLFVVHLIRMIITLYSKMNNKDETDVRNQVYSEIKHLSILEEDSLELVKKRANYFFNRLYKAKVTSLERLIKKKFSYGHDPMIHDMLFKPSFDEWVKLNNVGLKKSYSSQSIHGLTDLTKKNSADSTENLNGEQDDNEFTLKMESSIPSLTPKISLEDSLKGYRKESKITGSGKTINSRYLENFEEIELLGKGASGEVIKVKNKLDGRFYAVKKIVIKQGHKLTRIMREVQALSRFNHSSILRYYQAWLEEPLEDDLGLQSTQDEEDDSDDDFDSDSCPFNLSSSIGGDSSSFGANNDRQFGDLGLGEKKIMVLFIQTEYCHKSLREALNDRGNDVHTIWRRFRQVLEGLSYIHTQKIIHRDLKPENIFMDLNNDIKIGDFGLATKFQGSHQAHVQSKLEDILMKETLSEKDINNIDQTMNVGTYFYRSPEVDAKVSEFGNFSTKQYDEKIDVFSLGIIFFEMWHPFSNKYERFKILRDLKNRNKLPTKFEEMHPRQSRLIKWMLEKSPSKRPTVEEILNSDLMPPKVEEEYLKDIKKIISNPTSGLYKDMVEELFNQKGNNTTKVQSPWTNLYDNSTDFFTNVVSQRLSNYFRHMGCFPIKTSLFELSTKKTNKSKRKMKYGLFENDPRICYLGVQGSFEYLKINPRRLFKEQIKQWNQKFMSLNFIKCYEVTDIYSAEIDQIQKRAVLNYDSIYITQDFEKRNIIETICLNLSSLEKQLNTAGYSNAGENKWNFLKLKINNMKFVYLFFDTLKITQKQTILICLSSINRYLKAEIDLKQVKQNIQSANPLISEKVIDKMIQFFSIRGTIIDCKKKMETMIANHDALDKTSDQLQNILDESQSLFESFNLLQNESQKRPHKLSYMFPDYELDLALLDLDFVFKKDVYYEIRYRDAKFNKVDTLSSGGCYHVKLPISQFGTASLQAETSKIQLDLNKRFAFTKKMSCGFTIDIEKTALVSYSSFVKQLQTEAKASRNTPIYISYSALICSVGFNPVDIKSKISSICWQLKIPNLIYIERDQTGTTSLEEQIEFAERLDISLMIILKEKVYSSKNKITVRWKKDKIKQEKEYILEELIQFLTKSFKN